MDKTAVVDVSSVVKFVKMKMVWDECSLYAYSVEKGNADFDAVLTIAKGLLKEPAVAEGVEQILVEANRYFSKVVFYWPKIDSNEFEFEMHQKVNEEIIARDKSLGLFFVGKEEGGFAVIKEAWDPVGGHSYETVDSFVKEEEAEGKAKALNLKFFMDAEMEKKQEELYAFVRNQVLHKYEVELSGTFEVYTDKFELYKDFFLTARGEDDLMEVIKDFAIRNVSLEDTLRDDQNVFEVNGLWVHTFDWEDADLAD